MSSKKQSPSHRTARPGDIFILLVPTAQELHLLRERQLALQSRYGGEVVDFVHITCDRFSPEPERSEKNCINFLMSNLTSISPFMLYTDRLVQFFAPYWGMEVLRWQVQETKAYSWLRTLLADSLNQMGCASHFNRRKPTTCTALRLENKIDLAQFGEDGTYPTRLFEASNLWVSKLVREEEFEILERIRLENLPA